MRFPNFWSIYLHQLVQRTELETYLSIALSLSRVALSLSACALKSAGSLRVCEVPFAFESRVYSLFTREAPQEKHICVLAGSYIVWFN